MENKPRIGVRYCGGCNPRYDRVSVVKRLSGLLPEVEFVTAQAGESYTAAIVVSGCTARCAKIDDLAVPSDRLLRIGGWEDLLPVKKQITELLAEKEELSLTAEEVQNIIPHRPPMLFVDKVDRLIPGKEIGATLFLDPELPLFAGHFPGEPVFPGALAVEAMAQAADLMLMTKTEYEGKLPLLMGVRKANFRRKMLPGETLSLHASLAEERKDLGWITCRCQTLCGEDVAAEAEIVLAMR